MGAFSGALSDDDDEDDEAADADDDADEEDDDADEEDDESDDADDEADPDEDADEERPLLLGCGLRVALQRPKTMLTNSSRAVSAVSPSRTEKSGGRI